MRPLSERHPCGCRFFVLPPCRICACRSRSGLRAVRQPGRRHERWARALRQMRCASALYIRNSRLIVSQHYDILTLRPVSAFCFNTSRSAFRRFTGPCLAALMSVLSCPSCRLWSENPQAHHSFIDFRPVFQSESHALMLQKASFYALKAIISPCKRWPFALPFRAICHAVCVMY